jgi:hypothetical protein
MFIQGINPPDVLAALKAKYIKEDNMTLLALVPDDASKIRHRKLTLIKNNQFPNALDTVISVAIAESQDIAIAEVSSPSISIQHESAPDVTSL